MVTISFGFRVACIDYSQTFELRKVCGRGGGSGGDSSRDVAQRVCRISMREIEGCQPASIRQVARAMRPADMNPRTRYQPAHQPSINPVLTLY